VVVLVLSRLDYSNGVLIGLPVYLVRRLQSELNAAARMIVILPFLRRSDHITDALVNLHWLRVPKRIQYRSPCLRTKCWKGLHRLIWVRLFVRLIYRLPGRRGLRSASTTRLVVPPNRLSTIGNRIFEVTAAQTWNNLLEDVMTSPTLYPPFAHGLKHTCFGCLTLNLFSNAV
jgi:hypothetical protein